MKYGLISWAHDIEGAISLGMTSWTRRQRAAARLGSSLARVSNQRLVFKEIRPLENS